ncbi:MAG: heme lyase CcmF/NrfE family subunit [Actinobacteria bacterium]|nr:heme lyase CcmF/NrfE family subunit [Actinomycetota bacterium]MBU1864966.1 heme lyase CcmF/NrfE family subunit [Actinomycetota bacterium]
MSALFGTLGTWAALAFALVLTVKGFLGLSNPARSSARSLAIPAVGLLVSAGVAMAALEIGLLTDDFSVHYIANNSASTTPFLYKAASAWAALEGSLVLWGLVLAAFTFFIWRAMRRLEGPDPLWAGALGVMGVVSAFFFFMMVSVSNPFEVCTQAGSFGFGCEAASAWPFSTISAPLHGLGPNPLLQNHPLMAVHPPLLYVGYVGMTAPFSFAMASLLLGESGDRWLRVTRNWTRIAWIFLTAGVVLGGLWSYEVLGWGGYWAWDPVENASFMPWLVATMFVHTAALQMRRGVLQAWSYALVIATFSLTILGTFLTRSGVINSVHSFTQSAIGPVLLWFLMAVLVGSFGVYAARINRVGSAPRLDSLASREGMFMINNLLLGVLAIVVLVGTLYPLFVEWRTGDQVGVGRPFFDRMALPLSFALLFAMAIGPITPFRKASPRVVWERFRTPMRVSLSLAALAAILWRPNGWILLSVLASTFVAGTVVRQLWTAARKGSAARGGNIAGEALATMRRDTAFWGGQIAHVGIAVLALGIALSANGAVRGTVDVDEGVPVAFAGFELTLVDNFERDEPNRILRGAVVEIRRGGDLVTTLQPRLNEYRIRGQQIASPAVDTGLRGDLYLSLASDPGVFPVELDLYWFPFIWLVWTGGFMAAAGGLWAWLVRPPRRKEAAIPEGAARV